MLIGLTGGIGSGKSTVSNLFLKFGFPVVDADKIAREVVEPEKEAWHKIIEQFGRGILLPDNMIDRKKLGDIIFTDESKRILLNKITHPIIIKEIMIRAKEAESTYNYAIVDIPLLFESKREELFDLILVVYVDSKVQLNRLMARDNIAKDEAQKRINAQMDLEEKKRKADVIINNSGTIEETEQQVLEFIKKIKGKLD